MDHYSSKWMSSLIADNEQETSPARRRFLISAGVCAAALIAKPKILRAQGTSPVSVLLKAAATAKLSVQPIRDKLSVIEGSGGNIAVLTGPDGKVLIDAGIAASKAQLQQALSGISSDPIKHLINTHWHFDHTDGNAWLHAEGASILAQENTKKHLSTSVFVGSNWQYTFPPAATGALPARVFVSEENLTLNGKKLHLKHYGTAHTDSDIHVHFVDEGVLHVADTWWNGLYPFIDYWSGGSIDGMIAASKRNLALTDNKMVVIPGHGAVGNRAQMLEYHEMLTTIRAKVADLKKQGKSVAEAISAHPSAAFDEKWGKAVIPPDVFVALVYQGV